jgi:hypothetical protein
MNTLRISKAHFGCYRCFQKSFLMRAIIIPYWRRVCRLFTLVVLLHLRKSTVARYIAIRGLLPFGSSHAPLSYYSSSWLSTLAFFHIGALAVSVVCSYNGHMQSIAFSFACSISSFFLRDNVWLRNKVMHLKQTHTCVSGKDIRQKCKHKQSPSHV